MKDDNTPTITSRRRKPTPHQHIRLEKAKKLKQLGTLTKKKRAETRKQKPGETDPEKMLSITPSLRKPKLDTLSKPAKPPAKFRKRQIHKSWLPTHLYHAKRAHMTEPKEPLWRFAIPLTPTEKCFRTTHRSASLRGCVAWDMSYMATIGVEGVEASCLGLLRSVGVEENALTGKRDLKWRRGTRSWDGWIRERGEKYRWIAPVKIVWCINGEVTEISEDVGQEKKKLKRKLLMRMHPSAFLQVWNEILKVAKIQRPPAMVEDLRFEIGSIEITGPGSTEALIGALHPTILTQHATKAGATNTTQTSAEITVEKIVIPTEEAVHEDGWSDVETHGNLWPRLSAVTNPSSLPVNALLGFNVSDPRLHFPPRTVPQSPGNTANDELLELLSFWAPDHSLRPPDLFDRPKRLTASRLLSSQKSVNRRKSAALPGAYPESSPKDPQIPVLLLASRSPNTSGQGTWTVLLPWDCVLPIWYSLMHYPLSTGGNPRFGGLQEKRQLAYEQSVPWFPGDYPGTKAGWAWEVTEREKRKQEWERRPKGKRTEWSSVKLGDERKGEVGIGWGCDWERLFGGRASSGTSTAEKDKIIDSPDATNSATTTTTANEKTASHPATEKTTASLQPSPPPPPPLSIHHLTFPQTSPSPIPSTALAPIHLTLLQAGHPTFAARIYRLPTTDPSLRQRWLALASAKPAHHPRSNSIQQSNPYRPLPPGASKHERATHLASTLLAPHPQTQPTTASALAAALKANHPSYPPVPDETDLIGFVTTGNFNLAEGKCGAVGNVAVARVNGMHGCPSTASATPRQEKQDGRPGRTVQAPAANRKPATLCIVREAGQPLGRLARWSFL